MTSSEIRQQFLDFFANKQHRIVPSAPVVPYDDPTLLFTNAGMNQFKDVFLGTGKRDYNRAADTQKCIRVSGKHNDLEEVGYDTYHHTLFEMLGNWSFGDYYKKEAIAWAWELLTDVWKLPKERLYATVYRTDEEAIEIWKTVTDIKHDHILKFDEKDNFWEMGETGPCGPCSEIHINLTDNYDDPSLVNAGSPDCIEIWNLVFIQYNRDDKGVLHELPAKHVDTGMGFERVCAVLQNKKSNYDTDVFSPILNKLVELSGIPYEKEEDKISMRVIADHIRTLSFAIADGAVPGNEGRGYVLRRILRRACRYGRKLNFREPFFYKLVDTLQETMGSVFPELMARGEFIKKILRSEEESFNRTLDRGIDIFDEVTKELSAKKETVIPGDIAFKLYDTFGFPFDLTAVMAREAGFSVDEAAFTALMNEQKERARQATKEKIASLNISVTSLEGFDRSTESTGTFTGYEELSSNAQVTGVKKEDEHTTLVTLDKTPFYVEAGGQTDDTGVLSVGGQQLEVTDVMKVNGETVHLVNNEHDFAFFPGLELVAAVDRNRRWDIMRNHTATHLLHSALRKVLGTHVQQAGSYVGPDRLRFDFAHFQKVSEAELHDIEAIVNEKIREHIDVVHHRNVPFEEAKKMGALMFFGDKYGDKVNVVQCGDYSMEFCGGTHVKNIAQIGLVKVLSESSISSGVRRIEATTGVGIERFLAAQQEKLRSNEEKLAELTEARKKLEKELSEFKFKEKLEQIPRLLAQPVTINGVTLYNAVVSASNMDELKSLGDSLREKMKTGVGLLTADVEGKVGLVCVVSDDLLKEKKLSAGKMVGAAAKLAGGAGGGKPHLATAGAKNVADIPAVLSGFPAILTEALNG